MRAAIIAAMMACFALISADASAVTVRAVADDFEFGAGAALEVEFTVDDAAGLTGLEFSVVYPSGLLAVEEPSTHVAGSLFSHFFVNHEADSSDLPAGYKRIAVAFAVAQPVSVDSGLLLTVSFPLRCSDFSGGWPDGRPVDIDIQDAAAWKASGNEIPAPVPVTVEGTTITLNCVSVPAGTTGFSTLKARHVDRGGSR